jgi:hypothetical protein
MGHPPPTLEVVIFVLEDACREAAQRECELLAAEVLRLDLNARRTLHMGVEG